MIRSLAFRLTLAFLLVGLIGAAVVPFLMNQLTQVRFEQFMVERDRSSFVTPLTQYYQANGNWDGVEAVFNAGQFRPPEPGGPRPLVLMDTQGKVVFSQGDPGVTERLLQDDQAHRVPIEVDGGVVGQLILGPPRPPPGPGSPEAEFLLSITRVVTYSALGATIAALLLGILLARTLTRPIRELTAATQLLARGKMGQQVAVRARDELGQLAAAFNQMSAELAHAGELRRQMTADIAHELRTPLSIILGYTESLSDGKLPATQETLDIMHEEAQHLSRLIEDLRALSLAEAGELPLARQRVAPRALLERVMVAHAPETRQRGISIDLDAQPGLPEIEVDAGRMAQVLENLISNALRYTPEHGQITLSAKAEGDAVCLQVRDNGVGIAPEDLPYVFNRFYRGDRSRQHLGRESGLGLAIAKSIVEAHGGSISAASTVGEGTTFTITLPSA